MDGTANERGNTMDASRWLSLDERLAKLGEQVEKTQIAEYVMLFHKPWRLLLLHMMFGIARGIGIAIGFTFFATAILYGLRMLGALNLPIFGDFIADIVKIVQTQLEGHAF